MNSLAFIAELVRALAWPAVTVGLAFMLKPELRGLVKLVTKIKYKELEVEFATGAAEVRAEAAQLDAGKQSFARIAPQIPSEVLKLLHASPRAAVIEAWREVEHEIIQAAMRKEVPIPRIPLASPTRLLSALSASSVVSGEQLALLHDLRGLRNQAAHAPDFALSETAAHDFAEAAARMAQHLREA